MMRNQWQNRIRATTLAFSLLFGAGIVLTARAQAQNPNDRYPQDRRDRNLEQYGNYGGSAELRQTALNAGYNDGVREGTNDSQNGRRANYQLSNAYRKATTGYSSSLGNRDLYRRYFREAFVSGYNSYGQTGFGRDDRIGNRGNNNGNQTRRGRNWDGYGNFGGSFELRQTALNAGYNEGIKQGRNDRNKRNHSDYRSQSNYLKATQDYSSKLGDRQLYQRYYREAFGNGYDDGISGN
ncbi:MAG TPA: hypothetical protein VK582_22700 [Pyrinomonadaceae bacterium]|nr:hypothetical protein [Pyrinomonadaceae bacterium]